MFKVIIQPMMEPGWENSHYYGGCAVRMLVKLGDRVKGKSSGKSFGKIYRSYHGNKLVNRKRNLWHFLVTAW